MYIWYSSNNLYFNQILNRELLYTYLNGFAQGYVSFKNYLYIYSFLFVFFLPFLLGNKNPNIYFFIRNNSRKKIFINMLKTLTKYTFVFVTIHSIINIVFLKIIFNMSLEIFMEFLKISLINYIYIYIFYFIVGLIYITLEIFFTKILIAQIGTLISLVVFHAIHLKHIWTPASDLIVFEYFYYKELDFYFVIFSIAKQLIAISILLIIAYEIFKKKDIYNV